LLDFILLSVSSGRTYGWLLLMRRWFFSTGRLLLSLLPTCSIPGVVSELVPRPFSALVLKKEMF